MPVSLPHQRCRKQPCACFRGNEAGDVDERDVAPVKAEFFRDKFQERLVCLSLHRRGGDFDFHGVPVLADDLVAPSIRDDAELQPARAGVLGNAGYGFT